MSLYNDIRPKTLNEVMGQDNIKTQLSAILQSGNIPNALLLTGPRGTGKTTIARIIARTLNCEKGEAEPCGECQSCKDILSGASFDVVELDAASNNSVEDVRGIIEKAQYAPVAKYKVFILDEVHMFSNGAWNALLKTLEEPPKNVVFIMCTTEEHKVPATIISRCRKFFFEKIDLNTVATYLSEVCDNYGKAYELDALRLIAQASDGCMRDALSIMESFFDNDSLCTEVVADMLGMSQEDAVFGILNAVSSGDVTKAITTLREQSSRGVNLKNLTKALVGAVTDTMFVLSGMSSEDIVNTKKYKELLAQYASMTDTTKCLELSSTLSDVYSAINKVPDALFIIESALIKTINYESSLSALEKRVAILETAGVAVKAELTENKTQASPIVEFPAASSEEVTVKNAVGSFIQNVSVPVVEEEVSNMDLAPVEVQAVASEVKASDVPFEEDMPDEAFFCGVPTGPIEEEEPVYDIPSPEETVEKPVASQPQPQQNVENNNVPADIPASLLAHLPKGTVVCGIENSVPSSEPAPAEQPEDVDNTANNNDTQAPNVGEVEPLVTADNNLPPMGFGSFADWL